MPLKPDKQFDITWFDSGREPQCPPDPNYPEGKDFDVSDGAAQTCTVELPYPAQRCGHYIVRCALCRFSMGITTAGRPDDPRKIKMPCAAAPTVSKKFKN